MERLSKQRTAIQNVIASAGRPLSPQEVLDLAKARAPGIGIATVYRALKALSELGLVRAVTLPSQGARYEVSDRSHHHHFQCRKCYRVFDVHGCPGRVPAITLPRGFVVDAHEITLYGRCKDCASQPGAVRQS